MNRFSLLSTSKDGVDLHQVALLIVMIALAAVAGLCFLLTGALFKAKEKIAQRGRRNSRDEHPSAVQFRSRRAERELEDLEESSSDFLRN